MLPRLKPADPAAPICRILTFVMARTKTKGFDAKAFLASVGEGRKITEFCKNKVIFSQGDAADSLFYIRRGKIKLTVVSARGKEAVIGLLGAGDFFGEGCLTAQTVRMATASTLTDSRVVRLEKDVVMRVLRDQPDFSALFIAHLLSRNIRIQEDLVDQLFNSSEKRLARLLLLLANFGKPGEPQVVIPKVSQETLAEMIGTTRSRVSYFMNKFRKLGLIEYNHGLKVHSSLLTIVLRD